MADNYTQIFNLALSGLARGLVARSPSLDGALWKIHQPFEPMDSGPHTNLGFGDGGLFIRPLSCLLSGEGVLSHGSRPHPDGVGLSRLRERRAFWQVRTSVSQTEVTVKLREAIEGCFTTQAPNKERLFIPRMESRGLSSPTYCKEDNGCVLVFRGRSLRSSMRPSSSPRSMSLASSA